MGARLPMLLAVLLATAGGPADERPIALTGGTLVTAPGAAPEPGTLVIRGGLIESVGPNAAVPADARIIDAKGLTLYAGFIDAATVAGLPEFKETPEQRAAGEGAPRDFKQRAYAASHEANRKGMRADLRAEEHLVIKEDLARKHLAGGFTAAHVLPSGAYFAGHGALVTLSGAPRREALLRPATAQAMSFKAAGEGYPQNLLGITAHLRQTFLDARHHAELLARPPAARPPHDAALDALAPVLAGRTPVLWEAETDVEIRRVLDLAAEFKLTPWIVGGRQAHMLREALAGIPVIVPLKGEEEPKQKDLPDRAFAEIKERWLADRDVAASLRKAGVPLLFSSRGLSDPKEALAAIAALIERGLPREAALAALTTTPAARFGLTDRLGTLEAGKIANIVALTAPLGDKKAKVRYAFADGRRFEFDVKPDDGKSPASLAGNWKSEAAGPELRLELTQEGDKLKGTLHTPWGKGALEGTVSGQRLIGSAKIDETTVDLTGELKEEKLSGKARSPRGELDFVAGRQKDEPKPPPPDEDVEIDRDRLPPTRTGGNALLIGARLLTMSARGTVERGWILVEGGRIRALGDSDLPPTPHRVIDVAGLTVIPGIIDCHSHIAADAINESSHSISSEVRIGDVLDPHDVAIYRAAAGGCTTANILHGSANTIGGQNAVIKMRWGTQARGLLMKEAPPGIKFALGENVKQSNWGDRRGQRYPNTRMGVESVLQAAFTEAAEYKRLAADPSVPRRRDLRLEALVEVMEGRRWVHCHCYRADEILMILRTAESFGFRIKTLQHVLEGYRVAPEIAAHGAGGSTFADWWAYKIEAFEAIPHNAALMTRAGIVSSINSDSANHIRYLNLEAAKGVKYGGLSAEEALKLVTLNPARQLGIEAHVGSIEPGKAADLAFYNGHPLSPYSRCVLTLVDGEIVFEDRAAPGHPTPGFDPAPRPGAPPAIEAAPVLALTGARIVPVKGEPIARGTLVIREGKIAALGADTAVPPGAKTVDLSGLSIYPGLIDAGTHLGLTEIGSVAGTVDTGEIASMNPDLRASTAFNPHSDLVPVARAAGVTSVLVSPQGGLICGQASLMRLEGWTPREATVADAVGLTVAVPAFVWDADQKEENKKKLKELRELIEEAKDFDRVGRAPTSAHELKLAALAPYAAGRKPMLFRAQDKLSITAIVELSQELGLKPVIVGGRDAWKVTELLKKHDVPVILGPVLSEPAARHDPYDSAFATAARLHTAGVRFCLQTDDASNVRNLPIQAAVASAYGLPRDEALRSVTIRPAEILGVADRLGSLEPGKAADLIVTTGDPLEIVTEVRAVFIGGRPVPLDTKHTRLYEKFKARPREGF